MKVATPLLGTLHHWARSKQNSNAPDTIPPTSTPNFVTSQAGGTTTTTNGDNFNRVDGDVGSNWADTQGGGGRLVVSSNHCKCGISGYREMKYTAYTPASADYDVTIKHISGSVGVYQITGRETGTGGTKSNYRVQWDTASGDYYLIRTDNNADTTLGGPWTQALSTNDVIGIRFSGTSISVIRNGSVLHTVTSSTYSAAGNAGIGIYDPAQASSPTFDDFTITETTSTTPVVTATWDPATDNVAVVRTQIERQVDGGAFTVLQANASSPYSDNTIQTGHTYGYRTIAFDAAGNASAYSSVSSQTIAGSVVGDTTPPTKVTGLQIESGGGSTLETYISWLLSTDSGTGVKDYEVLVGGAVVATILHPRVGATFTSDNIGGATPAGSDSAGAISGGGPELWNIFDSFFFNHTQVDGDYDCKMTVLTNTGLQGNYYGKVGAMERETNDPASRAIWFLHFPSTGANTSKVERRELPGASATGTGETSGSLSRRYWLSSRYQRKTVSVSSITTPGSESWTQLDQREMAIAQSRLVGRYACNASGTYQDFSLTASTRAWFKITGVAGTSATVTVRARDNAPTPNTGTASDPLTITWSAASSGGGGGDPGPSTGQSLGGFYGIGGFNRNGSDATVRAIAAKLHRMITTFDSGADYAPFEAAVQAINSDFVQSPYGDGTRLAMPGLQSRATAANLNLKDSSGNDEHWVDGYGDTLVANYASASALWNPARTDAQGRTMGVLEAQYRYDRDCLGGQMGLATEGWAKNALNKSSYLDDTMPGIWRPGLFTPGNVNASAEHRAGIKALVAELRRVAAIDGKQYVAACNGSQFLQNADAAAIADFTGVWDVLLMEHIASTLDGNWFGTNGWLTLWNSNIVPLIRAGGFALFDADINPPGDPDRARQLRYFAGACMVATNALFSPKVNPEVFYRAYVDTMVWADWFSVNPATVTAYSFGSAGKMMAWRGAAAGGSAGLPQTSATVNGMLVRSWANLTAIVNPTDSGGAQNYTCATRMREIISADDPTMAGAIHNAGTTVSVPWKDSKFLIPWP